MCLLGRSWLCPWYSEGKLFEVISLLNRSTKKTILLDDDHCVTRMENHLLWLEKTYQPSHLPTALLLWWREYV